MEGKLEPNVQDIIEGIGGVGKYHSNITSNGNGETQPERKSPLLPRLQAIYRETNSGGGWVKVIGFFCRLGIFERLGKRLQSA